MHPQTWTQSFMCVTDYLIKSVHLCSVCDDLDSVVCSNSAETDTGILCLVWVTYWHIGLSVKAHPLFEHWQHIYTKSDNTFLLPLIIVQTCICCIFHLHPLITKWPSKSCQLGCCVCICCTWYFPEYAFLHYSFFCSTPGSS